MAVVTIALNDTISDLVTAVQNLGSQFGDIDNLTGGSTNLVDAVNAVCLDSAGIVNIVRNNALDISGDLSYNSVTGALSFTERTDAEVRGLISLNDNGGLGSMAYSSATGIISYNGPSNAEVRGLISVNDNGGLGSMSYSSATGVITYTGPSDSDVRGTLSGADSSISVSVQTGQISLVDNTVGQAKLKNVVSLVIYDSAGTVVKTLYGAGA